jgi:hypothetical protein
MMHFDRALEPFGSLALPIGAIIQGNVGIGHLSFLFPLPAREIRRIAGGKRFLEGLVHFFFQVPISISDFLVRSIRAHGVRSTKPHLFPLQESRATTG